MREYIRTYLLASFSVFAISLCGCADASSANQSAEILAATPEATHAVPSQATQWTIQPEASHIRFSALQEGEPFTGEFTEFSGSIQFDPQTPETAIVDITIPVGSVEAGSTDRNSTVPSKVWFSAKAFPNAKFTSKTITQQGGGYLAKGELTLKGASLPFDLPFTLQIKGNQVVMTGQAEMDRTLWNVGSKPWDTDEWVSRNVALDIQVTATREN